jgi:hypothetical protein
VNVIIEDEPASKAGGGMFAVDRIDDDTIPSPRCIGGSDEGEGGERVRSSGKGGAKEEEERNKARLRSFIAREEMEDIASADVASPESDPDDDDVLLITTPAGTSLKSPSRAACPCATKTPPPGRVGSFL